ncbi:hypothetical protein [Cellulomonas iranensis]|uniref:hypothetical protein n=1 Tax=Cellulomonas iranensis TaxID=76862 RepID=UPI0013D54AFE|nr:hypothetical protein [Cellulomonas iranensis]
MAFSERTGHRRPAPERTNLEQAPDAVRLVLQRALVGDSEWLSAYRVLSDALDRIPDSGIWSDRFAEEHVRSMISHELEWFEVFDLLEEYATVDAVNDAFVRTGMAYEMVARNDGRGARRNSTGGEIILFDPTGEALGLPTVDADVAPLLKERFEPAAIQWERAIRALNGRPSDPEKAIGEAMGATEAVVHQISGNSSFGNGVDDIFRAEPDWVKALAKSIKALYGYASQAPGVRHGRYADPAIEHADARHVVRVCGAAIAHLIDGERAGRWG